jgi:hypothetical protein
MNDIPALGGWRRLSCYTANLAAFLEKTWSTESASERIARTARLSIGPGVESFAFSQHSETLFDLGRGRELRFEGADDAEIVLALLHNHIRDGSILVLAHSAYMPWSVIPRERNGPHLVLLDRFDELTGTWSVLDHFAARMPDGRKQEPFFGAVDDKAVLDMMSAGGTFSPIQEERNAMMSGIRVELPANQWRWLTCVDRPQPLGAPSDDWVTDFSAVWEIVVEAANLDLESGIEPEMLDDLWAAAQHQRHRCAFLLRQDFGDANLIRATESAWRNIPRTFRLATASALRGHYRPGLTVAAAERLVDVEIRLQRQLQKFGWAERSPARLCPPLEEEL